MQFPFPVCERITRFFADQSPRDVRTTLCLFLAAITTVVYCQVASHDFLNYDDQMFVYDNPHVYTGLSGSNFKWAFTSLNGHASYWHPLTWLSLQLDCQLFGVRPGLMLLTNLWIHLANSVLLFIVLDKLTGKVWRSAFVVGLFALHPLHIETVAWVSERKTLLCAFFWLLATLSYVRYTRFPRIVNYLMVLVFFAASLMSKPFSVTMPFTLLLLDFWPLGRWYPLREVPPNTLAASSSLALHRLRWLVAEKVPLFLLAAAVSWLTILAQSDLGAISSLKKIAFHARLENAIVAYSVYLRKMVWPSDLAPIYPIRTDWPWWQVVGSALFLISVSALIGRRLPERPYLGVGWCWYLGTLVPVIGLVQVGSQGMADRYTYVPLIGIFICVAWGSVDLAERMPKLWTSMRSAAAMLLFTCALSTGIQVQYWKNSIRLFAHAVRATDLNSLAYLNLALAFHTRGNLVENEHYLRETIRLRPGLTRARVSLAATLYERGDVEGAFEEHLRVITSEPDDFENHATLANLYENSPILQFHDPQKAVEHARKACELTHYQNRELLVLLSGTLAIVHKYHEAREIAKEALAVSVSPMETGEAARLLARVSELESHLTK